MNFIFNTFASAYGSSTYGSATYQASATSGNTTGSSTSSNNGSHTAAVATTAGNTPNSSGSSGASLTNTGFDILLIVSLACVILFVSLIVRFWKRPKTHKTS